MLQWNDNPCCTALFDEYRMYSSYFLIEMLSNESSTCAVPFTIRFSTRMAFFRSRSLFYITYNCGGNIVHWWAMSIRVHANRAERTDIDDTYTLSKMKIIDKTACNGNLRKAVMRANRGVFSMLSLAFVYSSNDCSLSLSNLYTHTFAHLILVGLPGPA